MGGDIFYHFLNKIFDRSGHEIEDILPQYLSMLVKSRALDQRSFTKGLSKFFNAVPNIAADYPMLPQWLSQVMMTLYESKAINFKDLYFFEKKKEGEEDQPMVEDYFRIIS